MTMGLASLCDLGFAPAAANDLAGTADALTATASGSQTTSLLLPATVNRFGTVATHADGCLLPFSQPGAQIWVINGVAIKGITVFAQTGDTINGVTASTGLIQNGGTIALYVCPVAGRWFRFLSA